MAPSPKDVDIELYWRDAKGVETVLAAPPRRYLYPRISPDGKRVALDVAGRNRDIWVLEVDRGSLVRITSDPSEDVLPWWQPDGRRLLFSSNRGGNFDVYSQAADGSGEARLEVAAPGTQIVLGNTPDGRQALVAEEFRRISVADLERHSLQPLLRGESSYWSGAVSPDGRWIAYESNESGEQMEIFLRPYPDAAGRREKVSVAGGRYPAWGPRGSDALYFIQPDGVVMRAEIRLAPQLHIGTPSPLFKVVAPPTGISGRPYDVSPVDGRFLLTRAVAPSGPSAVGTQVSVVLGWFHELGALLP